MHTQINLDTALSYLWKYLIRHVNMTLIYNNKYEFIFL